MKLAIAIHLAPVLPCLPDQLGLARVFPGPLAQRAPQSGIEAAGMDAQTTTHHTHREQRTMLGHERVSHFASRANYAAEITSAHVSLLASKFGKKASTNLGAVRIAQNHLPPLGVDGDFERYYSSKGTLIKDIVHFLKSVAEMILKFYEFWTTYKPELISSEEFVWSDKHRYAGTADIVCKMNDEIWLLDIKTSNSIHKSYDLQLASYAKALEESKDIKIQRTGIVWLKASSRGPSKQKNVIQGKGWKLLQIDEIDKNFELFQMIYKLYSLENPTTEPIYNSYPTTLKL